MSLRRYFRRRQWDQERARELESHLAHEIDDNIARGMTPEEARRQAHVKFGNFTLVREEIWQMNSFVSLEDLGRDLRYARRRLGESPAFSIVIIAMLALAIAATATIFSIADVVLLHPLPFPNSDRLLKPWEHHPLLGKQEVTYPDYIDWRKQNHVFDGLAATTYRSYGKFIVSIHGHPAEEIEGTLASTNLFTVLDAKPMLGRGFLPQEETPGQNHVVILSHRLWQSRFGSNRNVLGRPIVINDETYTVIGVLPKQLEFPTWADIWLPMPLDLSQSRASHILEVVGKRKRGTSIAQVRADMQAIVVRLQREYPITNKPTGFVLTTLVDHIVGNVRAAIWSLSAAALLVLFMTCANVANLLLVRGISTQKDMCLRSALGASRSRLIVQSLVEHLLLSCTGIVLGLSTAYLLLRTLRTDAITVLPRARELALSSPVSLVTAGLCLAITILFGLTPTLQMLAEQAGSQTYHALKQGSRSTASAGQLALQKGLLRVETALAVVVLIATGLLLHSFRNLLDVDLGFHTAHILTLHLTLPPVKTPQQGKASENIFFERLLPRLRQIPGVQEAATVNPSPFVSRSTRFAIADQAMPADGHFPVMQVRGISPEYFTVLGIHAWKGRLFNQTDCRSDNVLINRSMVNEYFNGKDATGRGIMQGFFGLPLVRLPIVGVVNDTKDTGIETDAKPTMYYCGYDSSTTLLVKTFLDPKAMAVAVQKQMHAFDPNLTIGAVASMDRIVNQSLAPRRASLYLFSLLGCFALLITSAGVFAVLSYSLAQRKTEIAVRIAVGATRADLARLFIYQTFRAVLPGLITGLILAAISTRAMASILFRVKPHDPIIFFSVPVLLGLVTLIAVSVPLHRAVKVDPVQALRAE